MHRMTVGMVETARRKTRFPTVGTAVHAKANPPSATRLFVFISSPSQARQIVGNEDMGHLLSCLSHGEEFNGHLYTYTLLYIKAVGQWKNRKLGALFL